MKSTARDRNKLAWEKSISQQSSPQSSQRATFPVILKNVLMQQFTTSIKPSPGRPHLRSWSSLGHGWKFQAGVDPDASIGQVGVMLIGRESQDSVLLHGVIFRTCVISTPIGRDMATLAAAVRAAAM